jgi:hypothetical protein
MGIFLINVEHSTGGSEGEWKEYISPCNKDIYTHTG